MQIEETYLDGTVRVHRAIIFKNPTGLPVKLVGKSAIPRELCVLVGTNADGTRRYASRFVDLIVAPGETVGVAPEVADALQRRRCLQPECGRPVRFTPPPPKRANAFCTDPSHPCTVESGLAPMLVVVGEDGEVQPTRVSPALTEAPPVPSYDLAELERRVLSRLANERTAK